MISLLYELPPESRIIRELGGDRSLYPHIDHYLLHDIRETLVRIEYFSATNAAKDLKQSDQMKMLKDAPKHTPYPGAPLEKPKEEKPVMLKGQALRDFFGAPPKRRNT